MAMNPDSAQEQIQQVLTNSPPTFSMTGALQIAARHFGIEATAKPLDSERDQNFQLKTSDGKRFTLKIANHAEGPEIADFQNQALIHIAEYDASIPVPRVIPTINGELHCEVTHDGHTHIVRVLSWLDGVLLDDSTIDTDLGYRLGSLLATLGAALKDFDSEESLEKFRSILKERS